MAIVTRVLCPVLCLSPSPSPTRNSPSRNNNLNHVWSPNSLQHCTSASPWREDASRLCLCGQCPQHLSLSSVKSLSQPWICRSFCLLGSSRTSQTWILLSESLQSCKIKRGVCKQNRWRVFQSGTQSGATSQPCNIICDSKSEKGKQNIQLESEKAPWGRWSVDWTVRTESLVFHFPTLATDAKMGVLKWNTNVYQKEKYIGWVFLKSSGIPAKKL